MADSKQILDRIRECIHTNELEFEDQVKLLSYLANDILKAKTRREYSKRINPSTGKNYCYNSHQTAKTKIIISGIEFIIPDD